jgi:hypothetical protein
VPLTGLIRDYDFHPPDDVRVFPMPGTGVRRLDHDAVVADVRYGERHRAPHLRLGRAGPGNELKPRSTARGSTSRVAREETEAMENEEWQETVSALVEAKRCLAGAWQILDGTDGAASGVEHALNAALANIDAIYAIEHVNAYNTDVASPVEVQEFWEKHMVRKGSPVRVRQRALYGPAAIRRFSPWRRAAWMGCRRPRNVHRRPRRSGCCSRRAVGGRGGGCRGRGGHRCGRC